MKFVSLLTFLLIPSFCLAITCDELQSPTQVREFLERSKDSNPILRRNVSTTLEISPCEKEACNSKNRKEQQKEVLHLLRLGDKSRVHFLEGSRSSQCLKTPQKFSFLASEASYVNVLKNLSDFAILQFKKNRQAFRRIFKVRISISKGFKINVSL